MCWIFFCFPGVCCGSTGTCGGPQAGRMVREPRRRTTGCYSLDANRRWVPFVCFALCPWFGYALLIEPANLEHLKREDKNWKVNFQKIVIEHHKPKSWAHSAATNTNFSHVVTGWIIWLASCLFLFFNQTSLTDIPKNCQLKMWYITFLFSNSPCRAIDRFALQVVTP